uniref:Secreted protein n=1 Tax=Theropithecus gelada TaxID=9565 RepID=A0A8D2EBK8_THEGE
MVLSYNSKFYVVILLLALAIQSTQHLFSPWAGPVPECPPDFITQATVLIVPQLGLAAELFPYLGPVQTGRTPCHQVNGLELCTICHLLN